MESMLDDLKVIHERDAQDALGIVGKQWQQLTREFNVLFMPKTEIRNIVVAGMGGSGWPASYMQTWPGINVPFEISATYEAPRYVNENTLFVASSYSGNTEETISTIVDAEQRHAQIVVMTSGGKLKEIAEQKGYPLYLLPTGTQPRMSSFNFISAFLELLTPLKLIDQDAINERAGIADWLKTQNANWLAEIPTAQNAAKQLAQELMGKSVIVYSGPLMAPAAHKWKICMTENAKNLSWWNQYSELNHNEFTGWTGHPIDKPFGVVEIRSNLEHERIQKRFVVTEKLLSGKRPSPEVVTPLGESVPQQLFWTSIFGDYVSIYLAILNGVNPTPVDLVEKFKAELNA